MDSLCRLATLGGLLHQRQVLPHQFDQLHPVQPGQNQRQKLTKVGRNLDVSSR